MVFIIGNPFGKRFEKGHIPWHKGKKTGLIPKTAFKKGENIGENNHNWKGDEVGYWGLHKWVQDKLGKPQKCEICGKIKGRIEWANKSGKYKRRLDDWLRLCMPCHNAYDKGREDNK